MKTTNKTFSHVSLFCHKLKCDVLCPTLILAMLTGLFFGFPAHAAVTVTWNPASSSGDVNWNNSANWNAALASGNIVAFGQDSSSGTSAGHVLNNNETAGFSLGGIVFNSDAVAYTLNGNSVTLAGNITNSSTNTETIGFDIANTGGRTITTTSGGGNVTFGGNVSGAAGGFTIAGSGTVTMNGINTYTGTTSVGSSTLIINGSINGSGIGMSSAGGVLMAKSVNSLTGTTSLNVANGTAMATLSQANNYTGATNLSGILQLRNAAAMASSVLTMSGGTLQLRSDINNDLFTNAGTSISASTATINVDQAANGSNNTLKLGNVNITGATTQTLNVTGGNGYGLALGSVTQTQTTATTLTIANSAPLTLAGFTTNSNATPKLSFTGTGTTTITGGIIQNGSASLALDRSSTNGLLILQGTSNMTGAVTIGTNGGTIQISKSNAFGSTSGIAVGAGGTLALRGDSNTIFGNGTTAYPITSLTGTGATINVDQASSATAGTTLSLGTVALPGSYTLNTTGANGVSLSLGAITANGANNNTIANNIASPGGLIVASYTETDTGSRKVTFSGTGDTSVTGAISQSGTLSVTVSGGGSLTLGGASSYTGGTTISNGKLVVTNSTGSATGGGSVTLTATSSGGHPTLSGSGAISGSVTATGTGAAIGAAHLAPGVGSTPGTLTLGNGLTIGDGTNLDYGLGTTSSLIVITGNLSLGSNVVLNPTALTGFGVNTTYDLMNYTGTLTGNTDTWIVSSLPAGATGYTFAVNSTLKQVTVTFSGASAGNNSVITVTPAQLAYGRVMLGSAPGLSGTVSIQSGTSATGYTIAGTGAATPTNFSSANGAVTSGSSPVFTAGLVTSSAGAQSGTLTIQNTGNDGSGSTSAGSGQGNAQSPVVITVSGTVVANRSITASTVDLGPVLVGVTTGQQTTTISTNSGDHNHATDITLAASGTSGGGVTVNAGGGTTLFNDNSVSTTRSVTGNFSTSGSKSGGLGLSVSGENLATEVDTAPTVNYTANVYQAALLTTGTINTTGTTANLDLTNKASTDGGQRAGVTITGLTSSNVNFTTALSGNPLVGDATTSDVTNTVGTVSVKSDRLNGTYSYTGSVTGTGTYTNGILAGQGSITSPVWSVSLSGTVSGQTSSGTNQARQAFITTGGCYNTSGAGASGTSNPILLSAVSGGFGTKAFILSGSASGDSTLTMAFSDSAGQTDNAYRSSDTLTMGGIHATGGSGPDGSILTDPFVLELTYDPTKAGTNSQYIGWYDAQLGQWVNAIAGNSSGSGDYYVTGVLSESYAAYLASISGHENDLAFQLNAFGYDSSTNTAWAVLNHNSDFAVIPEPSTWGMILSGFGMLIGFQKWRKRQVGT